MYQVKKYMGRQAITELTTPSMSQARGLAIAESANHPDHVYTVDRAGFGEPIMVAYQGAPYKTHEALLAITQNLQKPQHNDGGFCRKCNTAKAVLIRVPGGPLCAECYYSRLTVGALREEAEALGIDGSMNKDDLIAAMVLALHAPAANRKGFGPTELKAKPDPDNREFKRLGLPDTTKVLDETQGIVEALVSVTGIIDDGMDVIHAGAFTKTLQEHSSRVRILDSHNMWSTGDVIGYPQSMREVGRDELPPAVLAKWPEATGGLVVVIKFRLNTEKGANAFDLIKHGQLEYSIGFDIMQEDTSKMQMNDAGFLETTYDSNAPRLVIKADGQPVIVRNIREVRLWDVSPVVWGMNPATTTFSVKSADGIEPLDPAVPDEPDPDPVDESEDKSAETMNSRITKSYDKLEIALTAVREAMKELDGLREAAPGRTMPDAPTSEPSQDEAGPPSDEIAPKRDDLLSQIDEFLGGA